MPRRLIAALMLAAFAAGCTPEPALHERAAALLKELRADTAAAVFLEGDTMAIQTATAVAHSDSPRGDITIEERPRPDLASRPLDEFDLDSMSSHLTALECPTEFRPAVRAESLPGGGLLVKEGCRNFTQFDVRRTLLNGRELTAFDAWTPEVIDDALGDLALAVGPTAIEVALTSPAHSSVFRSYQVSAKRRVEAGCVPEAVRFGSHDDQLGTGLLESFCQGEADGANPRVIPLADLDGTQLLAAMDRFAVEMSALPGFDAAAPMSATIEWRDDELVLTAPGAVDAEKGRDLRVPLNEG